VLFFNGGTTHKESSPNGYRPVGYLNEDLAIELVKTLAFSLKLPAFSLKLTAKTLAFSLKLPAFSLKLVYTKLVFSLKLVELVLNLTAKIGICVCVSIKLK
jgi:hypothetical protein